MQEILLKIQNDSTLMLIAGIVLVILLVIVLIVVIFSTKVKSQSDKLWDLRELDKEKNIKIEILEKELQLVKIKNAANEQELQQFIQTKEDLASKIEELQVTQSKYNSLEKEYSHTTIKLESTEGHHKKLQEEHDTLQERTNLLLEENNKYRINNVRLLTKLEAETRHASNRLEIIEGYKREIKDEFEQLAKQIFDGNSQKFTEFFKQNLDNMTKPLQIQVAEFKKQVSDTYNTENQDRAILKNEINSLKELNEKISKDTIDLTNTLKDENKQLDVWGEMLLEHVLEASELYNGFEFERAVHLCTDENKVLCPDVIVHLPDNRDLIIDAKISLHAYERFINAEDKLSKQEYLAEHLDSIRLHVEALSHKNYESLEEVHTLDFIFMFIPIGGALSAVLEHDSTIYDDAFKKKILLVGPTTLFLAIRTIENVWKYERQNQNAQEIAKKAGEMYDKFVGYSEDLMKISKQIDGIQGSFSVVKNKLSDRKGNLVRQVKQLKMTSDPKSKKDL